MRQPKKYIRVLGIDDAPFNKFKDKECLIIGSVFRGGTSVEGILSTKVKIDGSDSTQKLVDMINKSKFKPQYNAVFLDGIALAGFNVIDINKLHKKIKIPIIVVMRSYPRYKKIFSALKKIKQSKKIKLIRDASEPVKINNIYAQFIGTKEKYVKQLLKICCTNSFIPECIRTSHLIAAGVVKGESKGNA